MSFCFQHSLRQLARYLASRPDLDDISLVRCTMEFAGRERDDQMVRLIGRYGFELVPSATTVTMGERALRFGENIHISLMVWRATPRRSGETRCAGAAPESSCLERCSNNAMEATRAASIRSIARPVHPDR
jgi:hypothetical protein